MAAGNVPPGEAWVIAGDAAWPPPCGSRRRNERGRRGDRRPRRVQHEHPTIRTAANAIDEKAATNTTAAEIAALLSDHTIRSSNHLEERI
jgi:hypothetical protein